MKMFEASSRIEDRILPIHQLLNRIADIDVAFLFDCAMKKTALM